jgi:hypothetical protein
MFRKIVLWSGVVGLLSFGIFMGSESQAQVKKGKSQPLLTKSWMSGINGPHCKRLKEILDAGPSDEKAWSEAAMHAEILNEASHVLMADGRCPDKVWADASTQLREGSAQVLTAVHAKNTDEARSAFGVLVGSCGSCHKAHKK